MSIPVLWTRQYPIMDTWCDLGHTNGSCLLCVQLVQLRVWFKCIWTKVVLCRGKDGM